MQTSLLLDADEVAALQMVTELFSRQFNATYLLVIDAKEIDGQIVPFVSINPVPVSLETEARELDNMPRFWPFV